MTEAERDHLIQSWIAYHKAEKGSRQYEEHAWAFGKLYDLIQDDPESSWAIILEILRREQHPRVLEGLAAGPLEDVLSTRGPKLIDRVENRRGQIPALKIFSVGYGSIQCRMKFGNVYKASLGQSGREVRRGKPLAQCGYSSMVECQPSKLMTRVRFPLPAFAFPFAGIEEAPRDE